MNKKNIANLLIVAAIFFAVGFFVKQQINPDANKQGKTITAQEAQDKAKKFIEENLVQPGTEVKVKGISEENNLYKIELDISGQELISYLSKDGEEFFPQSMNISETEKQKEAQTQAAADQNKAIPKNEKPKVEVFVMSYCPYGTQVQKGLLPVVNTLGDKADIEFKFVDYAMHGEDEINENLLQYCLENQNKEKYIEYLGCFLKEGDSQSCLASLSVNQSEINSCIKTTDEKFQVTENFKNKDTWNGNYPTFNVQKEDNEKYGVQGSPTIVINGAVASSARDPQSLLGTICGAFENEPDECKEALSSNSPTPGFGEGTTDSSTDAGCGE